MVKTKAWISLAVTAAPLFSHDASQMMQVIKITAMNAEYFKVKLVQMFVPKGVEEKQP